jgi:hypothetical protein
LASALAADGRPRLEVDADASDRVVDDLDHRELDPREPE